MLEAEGVTFGPDGKVSLERFQWSSLKHERY
jgi:hypothetical protein